MVFKAPQLISLRPAASPAQCRKAWHKFCTPGTSSQGVSKWNIKNFCISSVVEHFNFLARLEKRFPKQEWSKHYRLIIQYTEIYDRVSDPLTFSHTHRFSHIWPAILNSSICSLCLKNVWTKPTAKLYSAGTVSSSDFLHPTNTDDGPNFYRA